MALKIEDVAQPDEGVGDFIWRLATERILTEENTDEIAAYSGKLLGGVIPLPIPGKAKAIEWAIDRQLPQLALKLLRKVLEIAGLLDLEDGQRAEVRYPIPGIDRPNIFKR